MLTTFHNLLSITAVVFFIISFKKLKGNEIGFPLYFYIAFFPYAFIIGAINIGDIIAKCLLLTEFFSLFRAGGRRFKFFTYPVLLVGTIAGTGLIASTYSTLFNINNFISGIINISYIFMLIFMLYNRIKSYEGMNVIFECMRWNGLFLCLCAVIERYLFKNPRVALTMHNPNYFAFYLALVLCTVIYFKKSRILIPLLLFGIYMSNSGSVMIGGVLCCCIWMLSFFVSKKRLTYIVMAIIPLIAAAGLMIVGLGKYSGFSLIRRLIEWKDPVRVGIWADGLRDFLRHPFCGYGYYCWREQSTKYNYFTHNDLLRILVDCGLIGGGVCLAGWIGITKRIARSSNALLYLLCISIVTMFSCIHNNLNSYISWLFFGLVIFDKYVRPEPREVYGIYAYTNDAIKGKIS